MTSDVMVYDVTFTSCFKADGFFINVGQAFEKLYNTTK